MGAKHLVTKTHQLGANDKGRNVLGRNVLRATRLAEEMVWERNDSESRLQDSYLFYLLERCVRLGAKRLWGKTCSKGNGFGGETTRILDGKMATCFVD